MLILPMLAHAFQNGQSWEVVDPAIIKTIIDKLLDPPEEISAKYDEPLRIELLQLATLLLKYLQNDLVHHRKELIKFGWNHLKREDTASKQWAFVNVCHFLEVYQAPEKIILQVFVALLRTCQPENRMLKSSSGNHNSSTEEIRPKTIQHHGCVKNRDTREFLNRSQNSIPTRHWSRKNEGDSYRRTSKPAETE
ncbi:hypothetical protein KIW84_031307 [Lathyrus oleraceus]|uniref:Uncharacterized protein n=1 Tax=Pisum sativum TaxID=3888 RepID=A0A9D5AV35_PEA|nr:hypothetical protein KIW84_031307 [Pisum sativum]